MLRAGQTPAVSFGPNFNELDATLGNAKHLAAVKAGKTAKLACSTCMEPFNKLERRPASCHTNGTCAVCESCLRSYLNLKTWKNVPERCFTCRQPLNELKFHFLSPEIYKYRDVNVRDIGAVVSTHGKIIEGRHVNIGDRKHSVRSIAEHTVYGKPPTIHHTVERF